MVTQQVIGFWHGFTAPFAAARSLFRQPRSWPYVVLPTVVFLLIEAAFIVIAWRFLAPWIDASLPQGGSTQSLLVKLLSALVMAFAGWIAAIMLAPAISAPALERIVNITEAELRAPARAPLGFVAEFCCAMRSMVWSTARTLPVVGALSLLELLLPPVSVVVTPFKLLLGALGLAWGLFDYPLTLRGIRAQERFAFMKRHWTVVLGFGTGFSLLFCIPCFGIVMLPLGVAGATRLYWALERQ